ncbi:hypothetical protein [Conexibacter sp. SYSU D00693]|uniref:hypothetical protein n=1 Tax=Conexibacter sp. SYSU D00693 TaxID=2812560 RepID=UPI00196B9888|nr:hypothetical protein [Conexibacter sp. SYSU D00693]
MSAEPEPVGFALATRLAASPDAVWERVASFEGINHELGPWLRMTAPRGTELTPEAVPLGRRWFRSWLLLGGVLPVDYDDLTVWRVEPGRGFHERGALGSVKVWEHERTLEPVPGGTLVVDRLALVPRVPGTARVALAIVRLVFRWRHHRLAEHFGRL